ncbi:protein KRI1 homolog [Liolophura sinensis]|uniref:protein KRI1 homolog n=1 Tax=Liolophura sinensis TaxID=3198878 RepID=UPI0031589362
MEGEEDFGVLKINKSFAKNYDRYRQKEELQKLKDKYGNVSNEESTSSSETEDEDAEALTARVKKDWLRAYAAVKSRDPKIYQKDIKFYHSSSNSSSDEGETSNRKKSQKKSTKQKPVTIKDYERKVILEKGGVLSDEDEADYQERDKEELGYYEEQEEIKKSFQTAFDSDDSDTELLQHRPKTEKEKKAEEDDYREWLKGQKPEPEEDAEDLIPLKQYWTDPKLEEGEKFLRDYILNKGYLEKDKDRIPTYDEIVDEAGFSSEEEILKKQEEFETKYNFRYEEPDQEFIKRYPRTISESVRREENKRSVKRAEVKDRKDLEKHKKREELKQLKNLKKREILDKMERLKEITGNPSLGFNEEDLEADFDPEKYDRLMQNVFDDDYYGEGELTKPAFSDDEELGLEDNWDNWAGREEYEEGYSAYEGAEDGPHVDDPHFNMDADYDPSIVQPKREGKKQKKKSKFAQAVYQSKPVFDPDEKSFEAYFDEYYKLDYEDIIADLPCRFKYRKTVPNNYGLTIPEILSADDKELNSWCSVKKMSQYKGDQEEYTDLKKYRKKSKKKYNILTSLQDKVKKPSTSNGVVEDKESDSQKTSVKKKQKKQRIETVTSESSATDMIVSDGSGECSETAGSAHSAKNIPKKKRKWKQESREDLLLTGDGSIGDTGDRLSDQVQGGSGYHADGVLKKTKQGSQTDTSQNVKQNMRQKKKQKRKKKRHQPIISDDRLKAYGINPKTFKQKMKRSKTS